MPEKKLKVKVPIQHKDDWCWAAVAVGLADAYGTTGFTQCEVVNDILDLQGIDCCDDPPHADCIDTHTLPEVLAHVGHFNAEVPNATLFSFVKQEIDAGHPIAVRIDRGQGMGHFVVIRGYREKNNVVDLFIRDPEGGPDEERFETFRTNYKQTGFWERTFTTTGANRVPEE